MSKYATVFAWMMMGCTANLLPVADCESNIECRDAFGYGSVCGEKGLCQTVDMHERCDGTWPTELELPVSQDETFLMATLFDRSASDTARFQSAELAVREANEELSSGAEVSFGIIHCDYTPTDPNDDGDEVAEIAVELSQFLADDVGIDVIIGPLTSSLTTVVYNTVAEQHNTLIISPSATSTALIDIDGFTTTDASPGLLWRTASPDSGQGAVIYEDMVTRFDDDPLDGRQTAFRTQPTNNLAIAYQLGSYGESLNDIVSQSFLDNGGTVQGFPFESPTDIGAVIGSISGQPFDEVLIISSSSDDYQFFLEAASQNSYFDDKPLFMPDGAFGTSLFDANTPSLYPNISGTAPAFPEGTVYNTFEGIYTISFEGVPGDHAYTANSWDAAWMAMYAYFWALNNEEGISGVAMARGLRKMSSGAQIDVIPISLPAVIRAFENGDSVDLLGASGTLDFNPTTGELLASTQVWTVMGNGQGFNSLYVIDE